MTLRMLVRFTVTVLVCLFLTGCGADREAAFTTDRLLITGYFRNKVLPCGCSEDKRGGGWLLNQRFLDRSLCDSPGAGEPLVVYLGGTIPGGISDLAYGGLVPHLQGGLNRSRVLLCPWIGDLVALTDSRQIGTELFPRLLCSNMDLWSLGEVQIAEQVKSHTVIKLAGKDYMLISVFNPEHEPDSRLHIRMLDPVWASNFWVRTAHEDLGLSGLIILGNLSRAQLSKIERPQGFEVIPVITCVSSRSTTWLDESRVLMLADGRYSTRFVEFVPDGRAGSLVPRVYDNAAKNLRDIQQPEFVFLSDRVKQLGIN